MSTVLYKSEKIAYTSNGKINTLNIHIDITLFLHKISRQCLRVWYDSRGRRIHMISQSYGEQRKLPWQPNISKIRQYCTDFSSVEDFYWTELEDIEKKFRVKLEFFWGRQNSNLLSEFLREQKQRPLPWRASFENNKQELQW